MKHTEPTAFAKALRLTGTVILFLFGILFFSQSHLGVYGTSSLEFLVWLRYVGIGFLAHSALLFAAFVLKKANEREGIAIAVIFHALYFILMYHLFARPSIVPVAAFHGDNAYLMEDTDVKNTLVKIIVGFILVFIMLTLFQNIKTFVQKSMDRG